jgi:hypothetical protein
MKPPPPLPPLSGSRAPPPRSPEAAVHRTFRWLLPTIAATAIAAIVSLGLGMLVVRLAARPPSAAEARADNARSERTPVFPPQREPALGPLQRRPQGERNPSVAAGGATPPQEAAGPRADAVVNEPAEPLAATGADEDQAEDAMAGAAESAEPAPPPSRMLALADAVDLFGAQGAGLDRGPQGKADLGSCPPETAAAVRIALAPPAHLPADERREWSVLRLDGDEESWRIVRAVHGLDGTRVKETLATVRAIEGRLEVSADPRLDTMRQGLLAASVLLFRIDGGQEWQPVRLVRPKQLGAITMRPLGQKPESIELSLPGPLATGSLPEGLQVVLRVGDEEVIFNVQQVDGQSIDIGKLGPREMLVARLTVVPRIEVGRRPAVLVTPGIAESGDSAAEQGRRLAKLAKLATKDPADAVMRLARNWDAFITAKQSLSLRDAATMQRDVFDWLRSPLPVRDEYPMGLAGDTMSAAFDAFLARQGGGQLPPSVAVWQEDSESILRAVNFGRPFNQASAEWLQTYQQPLQAWWADYRPRALEAIRTALEQLRELAEREVEIRVVKVSMEAVDADGGRHEVVLVTFDSKPAAPATAGAAGPVGLD